MPTLKEYGIRMPVHPWHRVSEQAGTKPNKLKTKIQDLNSYEQFVFYPRVKDIYPISNRDLLGNYLLFMKVYILNTGKANPVNSSFFMETVSEILDKPMTQYLGP